MAPATLHPPPDPPTIQRDYDSFQGGDGDTVEEIADPEAITMRPNPFAWSAFCDVHAGTWNKPDGVKLDVAIKVLRPVNTNAHADEYPESALSRVDRRLAREMFTWRRLKGPRITPLLGYVQSGNQALGGERPCLISARRKNGNLIIYLKGNPGVDRMKLLVEAAEGLEYLHNFDPQIAHLDLKPENILVNDQGEAELCDFGLSKARIPGRTGYTTGPAATGTIPFTAPEILMDPTDRSVKADVYAFGGIILWALSDKFPFQGDAPGKITLKVVQGKLPKRCDHPIRGLPAAVDLVWKLMEKCWSGDPIARPNATELVCELKAIRALLSEL